jgi:hypothetical protein
MSKTFPETINKYVDEQIELSAKLLSKGEFESSFRHLEKAHIVGQTITFEHTRVHWQMLKFGWAKKDWHEIFGQIFRIIGASTKTPMGIYPSGNTGGANVSPFKPMPIPTDLQEILAKAQSF